MLDVDPSSFTIPSRFVRALFRLRMMALGGSSSAQCAPSISHDGSFVVGESRQCYKAGDVWTPLATITRNILEMGSCNRCRLEDNLDARCRGAIGLPASRVARTSHQPLS